MPEMGRYLKAYPVERLREFPEWRQAAHEPADRPFLYLQDDYSVTGGIFLDEEVVFSQVTPQWVKFCTEVLQFEIRNWDTVPATEGRS
jgi:hypothetical protein